MFASLRIRTAFVFALILCVLPAAASAATVTLAWNANTETNIGGYVLVYGTSPGSYSGSVDVGNTTSRAVSSLTSGTRYYFAVRAYNTSGVSGPLSSEVNELATDAPDVTAPVATMTAPAAGAQVSGSVALSATATDNVGVAGVTFRVDGIAVGPEDATAPYSFAWNTVTASNGSHTLTAVARDAAGNLGTSSAITIQVVNDGTAPTILTLTPAANASGVSAATAVSVRFSEALNPSSVSAANFELRTATTNALVTAAVSYQMPRPIPRGSFLERRSRPVRRTTPPSRGDPPGFATSRATRWRPIGCGRSRLRNRRRLERDSSPPTRSKRESGP